MPKTPPTPAQIADAAAHIRQRAVLPKPPLKTTGLWQPAVTKPPALPSRVPTTRTRR